MADEEVLCEAYGIRSSPVRYIKTANSVKRISEEKGKGLDLKSKAKRIFKDAFLPQGYPESVSEDYLSYQTWDTLQAFCSYITGTLATQAVLKGVGVGDSTASPVAATITWLLKDGLGMIGRILFAWLKGTDLDCNAKQWRLVADILNDLAMFFDLLAPLFPAFFMLIVCLSSITRSIVGVAGGATRAALVQHQARRDNMADVSAKDGSQETLVNLAGLIIGMILTPIVSGRTGLVWFLFVVFTILHLYSNFRAVSVVSMETFNQSRLHLLMTHFLSTGGDEISKPKLINSQESIIKGSNRKFKLRLGASLSHILQSLGDFDNVLYQITNKEYVIRCTTDRTMFIAFSSTSKPTDQLRAVVTAEIVEYLFNYRAASNDDGLNNNKLLGPFLHRIKTALTDSVQLVGVADEITDQLFDRDGFIDKLQTKGWTTSHHLLGLQEWRFNRQRLLKMN